MSDRKYGRIFTEEDVLRILWYSQNNPDRAMEPTTVIAKMDEDGANFKFPVEEPTFTLRARDRRAAGAIHHYRDHQSPRAPLNHLDGIDRAEQDFLLFRRNFPELLKDPD